VSLRLADEAGHPAPTRGGTTALPRACLPPAASAVAVSRRARLPSSTSPQRGSTARGSPIAPSAVMACSTTPGCSSSRARQSGRTARRSPVAPNAVTTCMRRRTSSWSCVSNSALSARSQALGDSAVQIWRRRFSTRQSGRTAHRSPIWPSASAARRRTTAPRRTSSRARQSDGTTTAPSDQGCDRRLLQRGSGLLQACDPVLPGLH
jgi:hypothetical protein